MIYDRVDRHTGSGFFPEGVPHENAAIPGGLYLAWAVDNELMSDQFLDTSGEELAELGAGKVSGPELYRRWGGELNDELFNETGRSFAAWILSFPPVKFWDDFEQTLAADLPSIYHVPDTRLSLERLRERLDARFQEWRELPETHRERFRLFQELTQGLEFDNSGTADVRQQLGKPLSEETVADETMFVYEDVPENPLTTFGRLEVCFEGDFLTLMAWLQPEAPLPLADVRRLLGAPDVGEPEGSGIPGCVRVDVFVVDPEAECMHYLMAHSDSQGKVLALSLGTHARTLGLEEPGDESFDSGADDRL